MNKKLFAITIVILLSIISITYAQDSEEELDPYNPDTWNEENIYMVGPSELAMYPGKTLQFWDEISPTNKDLLFQTNLEAFIGKAEDYFHDKFNIKITGLEDASSGLYYDGYRLTNGNSYIEEGNIPTDALDVQALEGGGFLFTYGDDNEIKVFSGSIGGDNRLIDGSQIVFSGSGQTIRIEKDKFTLSEGVSYRDSEGNVIQAQEDGVLIEKTNIGYSVKGKSSGTININKGESANFESNDEFSYTFTGDFEGKDAFVSIERNGEVIKELNGKFKKIGDAFSIESYDGKQSNYEDILFDVRVNSVGYPVVVTEEGKEVPEQLEDITNNVVYSDNYLSIRGKIEVFRDDFHVFSKDENAKFVSEDDVTRAEGKLTFENSEIKYRGLTDSSQFVRQLKGNNEFISINGDDEGIIAEFTKKMWVGDLLTDGEFVGEEKVGIKSIISNENGNFKLDIDQNSLLLMAEIEKDPTKFALLDRNLILELGDEQAYFGISIDFGMIYDPSEGNPVNFLSPRNTHIYLGNDADTIKGIVKSQIRNNEPIDIQLLELQKIYELERGSLIIVSDDEEEIQFEASLESFEKTKKFIEETYSDQLHRTAALTSFMIDNFENIGQDYVWSEDGYSFGQDEAQTERYQNFRKNTLFEIRNNLEYNEFIKYGGDLTDLSQLLYTKAKSNPEISPEKFKILFEQQFQNRIIYEDLAKNYDPDYTADEEIVIESYRALLLLEETTLSNIGEGIRLDRSTEIFSTRKLNLGEALALEYAKQDRLSDAIAVMSQLDNDFKLYVDQLSSQIDLYDPSNREIADALRNLKQQLDSDRVAITSGGFNKIQLDLYTQAGEIQKVFASRMGYTEKVVEAEPGLNKLATVVFSGGFVKDIVNLAGGFDDVKEAASVLENENQIFSRGVYGINSLYRMGVPAQRIDDWINDRMNDVETIDFVNKLLVDSNRGELNPERSIEFNFLTEDQRPIYQVDGKDYAFDPEQQTIVFDFLEEVRMDSRMTYSSVDYGSDIQKLIGKKPTQYLPGDYVSSDYLGIDHNLQKAEFEGRIRSLEMSDVGKVLSFIDDGLGPGTIAIGAATGGFGGVFFSTARGLTGAGLGIVENVIIDAAAGTLLVSSGVNPEEHPYLAMMASLGVAVGTSVPRMLRGIATSGNLVDDITTKMINKPQTLSYYAYGTNGQKFKGILEMDGRVLSGDALKRLKRMPSITGESGGTTALLSGERVSVISLDHFSGSSGHVGESIRYAEDASKYYRNPSNIEKAIERAENNLIWMKKETYEPGSVMDDMITSQELQLNNLKEIKITFSEMTEQQIRIYDELSDIPVVVLGKNNKNLEKAVRSSVSGEVSLPHLEAEVIAVPRKDIHLIESLIEEQGSSIKVIPIEELENMQSNYLLGRAQMMKEAGARLKEAKLKMETANTRYPPSHIGDARSWSELEGVIRQKGFFKGSTGVYSSDDIIGVIRMVQKGDLDLKYVTRSQGLRQKVSSLLNPEPTTITARNDIVNYIGDLKQGDVIVSKSGTKRVIESIDAGGNMRVNRIDVGGSETIESFSKEELNINNGWIAKIEKSAFITDTSFPKNPIDSASLSVLEKFDGIGTASEELVREFGYHKLRGQPWLYNRHFDINVKTQEVTVTFDDGVIGQYKLHISASEQDYDVVVKRMGEFFDREGIIAKAAPGKLVSRPAMRKQYGKVFTVYAKDREEMINIILESRRIHEELGVKGISLDEVKRLDANLQYETPVPGTGNMVYYTIESVDGVPIEKYSDRLVYSNKYLGQGPLDEFILQSYNDILQLQTIP